MVNDNSLQSLQSVDIVVVKDNYDEKTCGLFKNNGSIIYIIDDHEKKNGWLIGAIIGKFSKTFTQYSRFKSEVHNLDVIKI